MLHASVSYTTLEDRMKNGYPPNSRKGAASELVRCGRDDVRPRKMLVRFINEHQARARSEMLAHLFSEICRKENYRQDYFEYIIRKNLHTDYWGPLRKAQALLEKNEARKFENLIPLEEAAAVQEKERPKPKLAEFASLLEGACESAGGLSAEQFEERGSIYARISAWGLEGFRWDKAGELMGWFAGRANGTGVERHEDGNSSFSWFARKKKHLEEGKIPQILPGETPLPVEQRLGIWVSGEGSTNLGLIVAMEAGEAEALARISELRKKR